ncbi:MAG: electron transfer flavoprotein subunit alpha/FixB family protein [Actinobacteria bacterium]|nr:electron transfer flavoprotein subunit alpha/FixB family protein [Actinomycetota bacterium]
MAGNVWIVAESWKGSISDATYEALALGRELADGLGVRLEAVLLGHGARAAAASLGRADGVLYVDHPALADGVGEETSRALAALAAARGPGLILVPTTNVSWDLLGLLPARLEAPLVNFCREAVVSGGGVEFTSLLYGGKMAATVGAGAGPVVVAVLPGVRPAEAGKGGAAPAVEEVVADFVVGGGVRWLEYEEPEAGDVDITQQDFLVAVGRGISNEANVEVAEELAAALGGAVCGSRPVIDQGWLPLVRQVGKSGATVKPRFYVAAGISGAPEHTEGMKDAELIVAVNMDPSAPIFSVAHYGIVEDATDVLEALAEAVRKRKG